MSRDGESVVAVIPARGGSKGVPGKNVAAVGGVPLVARAVRAARLAGVADVRVSTDDAAIAAAARAAGAAVVDRPAEIAGDTATSESALLHALDALEAEGALPQVLVFLQATSPFTPPEPLRRAIERVRRGDDDVVLAAVETFAFLWRRGDAGAEGVNHDASSRPRRQDREPHFQETGAFYVLDVAGFRRAGFRFFGRVGIEPVAADRALEIDSPDELALARLLAPALDKPPAAVPARALVTDFDGVHTDDTALVAQDGTESVRVSRSDGLGVERLRRAGVPVLLISKERNPVVAARAAKLQVPALTGVDEKAAALAAWLADQGVPPEHCAYVGNDVNDLAPMAIVGWPIAVADAHPDVRAAARVVLHRRGGRGAVREAAELLLAAQEEEA